MSGLHHRFPRHGTIGLVLLLAMETAVYCSHSEALQKIPWWVVTAWATPVCWWAYVLVIDAWIYRRKGVSLLTTRREMLALQCLLSIAFWCIFEAYNRVMPGWRYENLLTNVALRFLGYGLSFATIMPAMFLTCELIQSFGALGFAGTKRPPWSGNFLNVMQWLGVAFCAVPPLLPASLNDYLWCCVWVGWFLMLEPINYRRAMPSLLRDWENGDWSRTVQLAVAGAICGLLWEFWNMWAHTRWVYIFPTGAGLKYFEMPVLGFLGFLPFALDYFAMFHFVASFFTRDDKLGI